jgi:hypothetical protein
MRPAHVFVSAFCAASLVVVAPKIALSQCALPYQLTNGQTADATQVMANFNALVTCLTSVTGTPGGSTNAVQYNAGSGSFGGLGPLTDGQLVVGSTGNTPQATTLTAGSGIAITNGAGSISISTTGTGIGLFGQVMSATPTIAGTGLSTWLNQGTAAVADTSVGMSLTAPNSSGAQLRVRYAAAPATPYVITALIASTAKSVNFSQIGIGWYDGTAKLHVIALGYNNGWGVAISKWNTTSSFNGSDVGQGLVAMNPAWVQIQDSGSTVSFRISADGFNFITLFSVAKASGFLGATGYSNIAFFVNAQSADDVGTVMSWVKN